LKYNSLIGILGIIMCGTTYFFDFKKHEQHLHTEDGTYEDLKLLSSRDLKLDEFEYLDDLSTSGSEMSFNSYEGPT
jgi:hypothetical protein